MVVKMFKKLVLALSLFVIAISASADKPEWAGEGKPPTRDQVEEHKDEMTSKHEDKKDKKDDIDDD